MRKQRVTAKQKAARRKNMAIARAAKKKNSGMQKRYSRIAAMQKPGSSKRNPKFMSRRMARDLAKHGLLTKRERSYYSPMLKGL